jgi:hypothetical protein
MGRTRWPKAPIGVQEMLVRSAPETYCVPPYVGVKGWIGIVLDAIGDVELGEQVVQSYCMIAPKKLAAQVGDRRARRQATLKPPLGKR